MNAMHPTGKQGRTAPSASSRLPQRPHPAFTATLCPPCLPGPAPVGTLLTWILTEVVGEVRIDHFAVAPVQQPMNPPYRVLRASSRPVCVLLRLQVCLEYRPQHQHRRRLRNPIPQAWNAQWTELPRLFLRDEHPAHRIRLVGAIPQVPRQFPDPTLHSVRLDILDRHTIHSCRSAVAPDDPPRLQEEILPPYLVDEGVKAPVRFFLRFRV